MGDRRAPTPVPPGAVKPTPPPAPPPKRGIARVLVTPELLAQAMSFPDGTAITDVEMDEHGRWVVLTVEHPDIRPVSVPVGHPPALARPTYRRDPRSSLIFVSWGQDAS